MRDYKANSFQMDSSLFRFGLTPFQFTVYSYLKYCSGSRYDTHFTVATQVEISDQFFGWVLGFGKKAKILEPPAVVDQFAAYLDKVRQMY